MNPNNSIYDGLNYTTKEVNSTFKMWAYGVNADGTKIDTIIGVSGLIKLVGVDLANSFLNRAFATVNDDKCICKLRRGLKVTFYYY